MKKFTLTALALAAVVSVSASGLDFASRVMLQRRALERDRGKLELRNTSDNRKTVKSYSPSTSDSDSEFTLAFVRLSDGFTSADLAEAGMVVKAVRGNVAIVALPFAQVEAMASHPAVRKMSLQRPVQTKLNKARAAAGVDDIHKGIGLDVPYTGKGVLAGIVDQGVDPNHLMFLNEMGRSRVSYLTDFDGTAGRDGIPNYDMYGDSIYIENEDGSIFWFPKVADFKTDTYQAYHGSHTMGILGGNYRGKVTVNTAPEGSPVYQEIDNPYYGVATDAMFAVSCGELADICIAYGLNGILDYAYYAREEEGIPSVVSLSLGNTGGPHDPNALFNYFLEECGKETILVLAAGNEGDLKIALNNTFTADETSFQTLIYPYGYRYNPTEKPGQFNTYIRNDAVYIYSNDATPFTLRGFIASRDENGNIRKRTTYDINGKDGAYFLSSNYYADYVGGSVNATVARYFDGFIGGGTMLDEDLNRFWGVFDYYLFTNPETGFNDDGSEGIIVGFEVIGEDGQRIDCYCVGDNTWFSDYGVDGYLNGMTDGTISDMAVTTNVLVVGAYNENTEWINLNGDENGSKSWYSEDQGVFLHDIGHYSSYANLRPGILADGGTSLPHVCAPGTAIISAMSTPYVEDYFKGYEQYIDYNFQAKTKVNDRTYYWKVETGTSMSTPFVAGSIALWLEADPTLTIDDVKDIIAKTAVRDEYVEKGIPAQWGAGKFDALAGLKEVIRRAGVEGVTVDSNNDRLIFTPAGNNIFDVFVGDAPSLNVRVFSLTGATAFAASFEGCEATVDLSNLTPGVYAVNVNGHSKKIVIR